ncbi:MAG: hypothetical protein NTW87_16975 [Planctomycetota bacterium]|nr:hypothetical protein [Planctomycetota bacterium]
MAKRRAGARRSKRRGGHGMTKAALKAWKARWELANQLDLDEVRGMTTAEKIESVSSLMAWARSFARPCGGREREDARLVSERWIRLKRAYSG